MFEVGVAGSFNGRHDLAGTDDGPAEQHVHDYRVEVVVRGERLPESGMLLDLDRLGAALSECIGEMDDRHLDALPQFAAAPTTVELVAQHVWEHLRSRLGADSSLESLRVTVYETPDAWASIDQRLGG